MRRGWAGTSVIRGTTALVAGALLVACDGRTSRSEPETDPGSATPLLVERTDDWGLDARQSAGFTGEYRLPEIMGSGVVVLDADGDGVEDLLVLDQGPRRDSAAPDRLYLGRADQGFELAADRGLAHPGWSMGAAAGDLDNDGDIDVVLGCWGPDAVFRNEGGGAFRDVTEGSGFDGDHLTTSVALLDFDGDGFLDVFLARYVIPDPDRVCGGAAGKREYCGPKSYDPIPDALYRNRGDGTFEDVSVSSGIAGEASSGLGVAVADFDRDGRPDIYVANDQRANHLWMNQGDGTFREEALQRGVALSGRGNVEASMGVDVGDVDGDGHLDVFLTHLMGETNTLYLGSDRGLFRDASSRSGVGGPSRDLTAFGAALLDLELDGDLDLVIADGAVSSDRQRPGTTNEPPLDVYGQPNQVLRNDGTGVFEEAAAGLGTFASIAEISRGLALADLDRDGDLDVVVTNVAGRARVYENVAPRAGRWLSVTAFDPALRRIAVGARIEVRAGGRTFVRLAGGGWSYLSGSSPIAHFGLGEVTEVDDVLVIWPGGERERFRVEGIDTHVRLERGAGE